MPAPARPTAAIRELGQVYLISQAYRRSSALPKSLADDARQAVGWAVARGVLLDDSELLRVDTTWRVFAVVSEAQPDRLRRVETWLIRQDGADGGPQWAVLIDFVPISTGAAVGGYLVGDQFDAELIFYPSTIPLRAQVTTIRKGAEQCSDPVRLPCGSLGASYATYESALAQLPWLGTFALSFRDGSVRRQGEHLFLYDDQNDIALPLHPSQAIQALPLTGIGRLDGIGLWNGYEFTLAWAETRLGRWSRS